MKICPTCGHPEETCGSGSYYLAKKLIDAEAKLANREKRCHSISGIAVITSVILLIAAVVSAVITLGVVAAAVVMPVMVLGAVLGATLVYYSQTSSGTAQDDYKSHAELAEVMVILQELQAWLERNRESKEETREDIERLMRQLQEGLENILNMLDSVLKNEANIDTQDQ